MLRPCIVAGPNARLLAEAMPWNWVPLVRSVTRAIPLFNTLVADPGFPLQLVRHDDVAAAIALAATTSAPAGAYIRAGWYRTPAPTWLPSASPHVLHLRCPGTCRNPVRQDPRPGTRGKSLEELEDHFRETYGTPDEQVHPASGR